MTIRELSDPKAWNTFLITNSINTFLQSWEWGQLQRDDGETVRYLGFFDNNQQIGSALVITVNASRGRYLLCPHGPFFIQDTQFIEYFPQFLTALKTYAQSDHAIAIRIAPLTVTQPSITSLFQAYPFRPAPIHAHTELTWVLDIAGTEDQILAGMRKTTRHAIKKAQKAGVTVDISHHPEAIDRFWPIYATTSKRHGFVPFSKDFLKNQWKQFAHDHRMYAVFAQHEGKDVAGALFVQFGSTVFYHHGASYPQSTRVNAPHLLQWTSIQEAKRRGASRYNFWGIARDDQPQHPFAGITVFKKGFGGYALDYMHLQDLPVSLRYWKLWAVETWRKYKRGF